jgi:hypothetical protein
MKKNYTKRRRLEIDGFILIQTKLKRNFKIVCILFKDEHDFGRDSYSYENKRRYRGHLSSYLFEKEMCLGIECPRHCCRYHLRHWPGPKQAPDCSRLI